MTEILLTRHAKAYANKQDFTAFGNMESPLIDPDCIEQAQSLNGVFQEQHGIVPEEYEKPVLSSEFTRPQQTATHAGFRFIDISAAINESDFDRGVLGISNPVRKHATELWVPEETQERAANFVERVRSGELVYEVYFTHGLFIASVLMHLYVEAQSRNNPFPHEFSKTRGFIPYLATITPVTV